MVKTGRFAIVSSADGRVRALDRSGTVRAEGGATATSNDIYSLDEAEEPLRISKRGVHLICATLDGRVRWRAVGEEPLGPFAASSPGVALIVGQNLTWFKASPTAMASVEDLT